MARGLISVSLTVFFVSAGMTNAAVSLNPAEIFSSFGLQGNPFESVPVMEKRMKKMVNSGVKLVLPYLMTTVTEIQLSSECTHGFLKLIRGVMDIRDWAFKMVDALGKPSAGILEGTATALGDYDECLDITVPKNHKTKKLPPYPAEEEAFRGQYCMVQINIPEALRQAAIEYQAGNRSHSVLANSKTFLRSLVKIAPRADIADLRLGVCIPSTCSMDDLQAIVNEIVKMVKIQAKTLRCEVKKDTLFSVDQIVILSAIGGIIVLLCIGTTYEAILRFSSEEPIVALHVEKRSIPIQFILSFSVYNNFKKMGALHSESVGSISCVRGMKFISVCLYVVVSTYATPHDFHFLKYRSVFHFYKFMEEWWFTVFANASAGVDTLFFITGLQITYRIWKKPENFSNGRVNINVFKFWGMWFFRLCCAQLLVVALFLCLPLIGKGPIWNDVVTPEVEKCREKWWMNALFINNFWPSTETCLTHTWLVTALMHLLLLAPILLYLLSRWAAVGIMVIISLVIGSSVAIALVTLINDLPPAPAFYFLSFLNLNIIWERVFSQAYDHLSPFCVGVLLGYYMAKRSKLQLSKASVIAGWSLTLILNMTVLCGLYGYRHGEAMETGLSAFYAAVHRLGWSLGIAWIVFACYYGYGGVIDSILSWNLIIPMERLTNLTFLLHPLILNLHGGQIREKMYMAHLDQAMYATAYIVFTVAFAGLCYVCFYSPFMFLESKLWNRNTPKCLSGIEEDLKLRIMGQPWEFDHKITSKRASGIEEDLKLKIKGQSSDSELNKDVVCVSISALIDGKACYKGTDVTKYGFKGT